MNSVPISRHGANNVSRTRRSKGGAQTPGLDANILIRGCLGVRVNRLIATYADQVDFFVAEIGTHRKGDFKYWDNLSETCFNNEVGYALYCYFVEVDTEGFEPQNFLITKNKLNSISKRLDTVYSFLKENYILEKKSVDEKLSDFFYYIKNIVY